MREKSEKPDEKLEGKIGPVMEVHMDANVVRSQLRYRPIFFCKPGIQTLTYDIIADFLEK